MIYSGQQCVLMRNYNSHVVIKFPSFKLQGTSEHIYIEAEIL